MVSKAHPHPLDVIGKQQSSAAMKMHHDCTVPIVSQCKAGSKDGQRHRQVLFVTRDFQTSHTATWSKHRHSAVLGLHQLPKPVTQTSGCHMKHCEHAVGSQARITSSAAYQLRNLQQDPHSGECPVGRCPSATVSALCLSYRSETVLAPCMLGMGCSSWRCVEKAYNPGQAVCSLLCVGGVLYIYAGKGSPLTQCMWY